MGLKSLKNAATDKGSGKKKSTTVVVQGSASLADVIRDLKAAKAQEKRAKSDIGNAEVRMFEEVKRLRKEACRRDRKVHPSVRVEACSESILATQKGQFKKMGEDVVDPVRKIVGEGDYARWFKEKTIYSFDHEALMALPNADEIADGIAAALGEHVNLLRVITEVIPTEQFIADTTLNDDDEETALKLVQDGFVIPHKMSFK